jgi:alkanesulfonate monooxygenase SsuD/methylene tetrahydromethanopterin reductase-like flavin-dependent oxidoreductase (luciferase family)
MEIGLALPQLDPPGGRLRWEDLEAAAARAEDLGFASLWLGDHPPGTGSFDPLPTLAALARRTARPRLGTLALAAPLRPPVVAAKALATLDLLAAGRLVVGIGAGYGRPAGEGHAALAVAVGVLRQRFGGGSLPLPAQRPHPPIWVAGRSDAILDVVAGHADGWVTGWSWTSDAYRRRCVALERACERAGRDPATVVRAVGLQAVVGEDEADVGRRLEGVRHRGRGRPGGLVGTVAEVGEQVAAWAEAGVHTLIVAPGSAPYAPTAGDDLDSVAAACSLGPDGKHRSS